MASVVVIERVGDPGDPGVFPRLDVGLKRTIRLVYRADTRLIDEVQS